MTRLSRASISPVKSAMHSASTPNHTLRPVRPIWHTTAASVSSMKSSTERETVPIITRLKLELGFSIASSMRVRGFFRSVSASSFFRDDS
eukprot:scaffold44539_cov54-Phaeocystis_antarctica.AAC.4